ncbi:MAG: ComF family protein [Thermoguttaceae bacterium]|nr:ComF family protein [Thermoguttaceae bacterium]
MKRETSGISAEVFARLLYCERKDRLMSIGADLVIPVPMHSLRHLIRGVNSAEQIARVLAAKIGIECRTNIIRRSRWTVRQATLPGNLRRTNLLGAFQVVSRRRKDIEGKTILLVDDVMTTGSTCSEIARVLRQEGAAAVHAAVLARAEVVSGIPLPRRAGQSSE